MRALLRTVSLLALIAASGCVTAYRQSIGTDTNQVFGRIYLTDFNTSWQAVLDALKNSRLDVSNREGGFVQTRWTDNTSEKNFTDSFGNADAYLKAQFRVRVVVAKGFFNGKPSVKVSVQKEQLVQRDVLEGWRPAETDAIDENTLLYRIGRLISIRTKLAHLEEDKTRGELMKSGVGSGGEPAPPSDAGPPPDDGGPPPDNGGPPPDAGGGAPGGEPPELNP